MPTATSDFDFRRPSKLGRDVSRALELAHETFARRVGTGWGAELRAYVQIDPAGISQMPYDDVVRSMPTPHLLVTAVAPPLPGAVVVDLDLQLGMLLVDRLLGGEPDAGLGSWRRPSEVEIEVLGHLGQMAVQALAEILGPLGGHDPHVRSIDVNPQLVQVAAPSDQALLVAFQITVSGPIEARGTFSVVYPGTMMQVLLEHLASSRSTDVGEQLVEPEHAANLLAGLGEAEVDVAVRLAESPVAAGDLQRLAVGDVLRLDHRVGRPAHAVVGDTRILDVHLGRLGPRRAAQVAGWRRADAAVPTSQSLQAVTRPPEPVDATVSLERTEVTA